METSSILNTAPSALSYAAVPAAANGLPLAMVRRGEEVTVQSIHGRAEVKRFLNNLGFVENAVVTVISEMGGDVIVSVKGTRVAVSKAMANKIYTA